MKNKNTVLRMCEISMISALSYVLGRLTISVDTLKITFAAFPILLLAYISPYWGDATIAAFIASFLGQLLEYGLSITTPLWIFPVVFRALIFWVLVHKLLAYNFSKILYYCGGILIAIFVTVLNTVVMAVDALIFGYYTKVYVWGMFFVRLGGGILLMVIMLSIVLLMAPRIEVSREKLCQGKD